MADQVPHQLNRLPLLDHLGTPLCLYRELARCFRRSRQGLGTYTCSSDSGENSSLSSLILVLVSLTDLTDQLAHLIPQDLKALQALPSHSVPLDPSRQLPQ
jgi:hypothetical protein